MVTSSPFGFQSAAPTASGGSGGGVSPFGSSNMTASNLNTTSPGVPSFGSPSSGSGFGFGSNNATSSNQTGTSSAFGGGAPSGSAGTGTGGSALFGSTSPTPATSTSTSTTFGGTSSTSTTFGTAADANQSSHFSSNTMPSQTAASTTGFGTGSNMPSAPAPAPAFSSPFGVSPNVPTATSTASSSSTNSTPSTFGTTFGGASSATTASTANNPFASSSLSSGIAATTSTSTSTPSTLFSNTANANNSAGNIDNAISGGWNTSTSNTSTASPFGQSHQQSQSQAPFGQMDNPFDENYNTTSSGKNSMGGGGGGGGPQGSKDMVYIPKKSSQSSIPTTTPTSDSMQQSNDNDNNNNREEELARRKAKLQAVLEEKKRSLLEKKQQKQQQKQQQQQQKQQKERNIFTIMEDDNNANASTSINTFGVVGSDSTRNDYTIPKKDKFTSAFKGFSSSSSSASSSSSSNKKKNQSSFTTTTKLNVDANPFVPSSMPSSSTTSSSWNKEKNNKNKNHNNNNNKKPSFFRQSSPHPEGQGPSSSSFSTGKINDGMNKVSTDKKPTRVLGTRQSRSTTKLLPPDLQVLAATYVPGTDSSTNATDNDEEEEESNTMMTEDGTSSRNSTKRKDKSLIGTCIHMCPDEELLRRDNESDLQLLELPDEDLHPNGWNLRNTAVKRFRRSAADFKLNIPELIRPPHVLERCCGYLEEWVMERDRQGPDPRYDGGQTPPPLDVYQFIWDRTRMIRKDFILQNYIGTGGVCSAVAVRCHERIARWHTMCEHQLSHIPDFVKMQSQQNIQELGQTLKTLNYYYDDTRGRSQLEDAASQNTSSLHGCENHRVMGKDPVDFDGTILRNEDESKLNRIIGCANTTAGTAEPEMRGLYILLTIDNDGGMEVLKYAARLSVEKPKVFHSRPVQLALQIYKAKKEYNYARFFSILKSPGTPYLYACIMFKYVEQMRRVAFRIMTRTFGRSKDGEGINDSYPLVDLVNLLCFDSPEEARNACQHYNITVQTTSADGYENVEMVSWKASEFRDAKDPVKGHTLKLNPWKMTRTIEAKLNQVTRLGVCRGEVSGFGATLDRNNNSGTLNAVASFNNNGMQMQMQIPQQIQDHNKKDSRIQLSEDEAKAALLRKREERKRLKLEQEKARVEEERRRVEAERAVALEAVKAEEKRKQDLAVAVEKRRREEEEAERQRLMKLEREKKAAAQRKQEEAEKARLEAIERERMLREEKERQHQAQLKREEEARKERIRLERERQLQREQEMERLRLLAIEKEREEEMERIRKAKLEEERRLEQKWQSKIEIAKKILILKKWKSLTNSKRYKRESTKRSLESIGLFNSGRTHDDVKLIRYSKTSKRGSKRANILPTMLTEGSHGYEDIFYQLGTNASRHLDLPKLIASSLSTKKTWDHIQKKTLAHDSCSTTVLFKLGIILVHNEGKDCEQLSRMIQMWIDARLDLNTVQSNNEKSKGVRTVVVCHDIDSASSDDYDGVIFLMPPTNSDVQAPNYKLPTTNAPHLFLQLDKRPELISDSRDIGNHGNNDTRLPRESYMEECEACLEEACEALVHDFVDDSPTSNTTPIMMERIPLRMLCCKVMKQTIWSTPTLTEIVSPPLQKKKASFCSPEDKIVDICHETLALILQGIDNIRKNIEMSYLSNWPGHEFGDDSSAVDGEEVPSYFSAHEGLPMNWMQSLNPTQLENRVWNMFPSVQELNPAIQVLDEMLHGAPLFIRQMCGRTFQDKQTIQCFESALVWQESSSIRGRGQNDEMTIYLPVGEAARLVKDVTVFVEQQSARSSASSLRLSLLSNLNEFDDREGQEAYSDIMIEEEGVLVDPTILVVPNEEATPAIDEIHNTGGGRISKRPISPTNLEKEDNKEKNEGTTVRLKRLKQRNHDHGENNKLLLACEVEESKGFTAELQALLDGDMTLDLDIGSTTLAEIISEDCSTEQGI